MSSLTMILRRSQSSSVISIPECDTSAYMMLALSNGPAATIREICLLLLPQNFFPASSAWHIGGPRMVLWNMPTLCSLVAHNAYVNL